MIPQSHEHIIRKLGETAYLVEAGRPVSVTKLMPVFRLAADARECAEYLQFLLQQTVSDLQAGRSLSRHAIPLADKIETLKGAIQSLNDRVADRPCQQQAKTLRERIYAIEPGWVRVRCHATRRALEDADLLLAEFSLLSLSDPFIAGLDAYETSRFFVTSYDSLRFYVPRKSAPRWHFIHDYWASKLNERQDPTG